MAIEVEQLKEEQRGLQVDFDKLAKNIKQVEVDLNQMKANLNAINGAVQQVSKLIGMAGEDPVKTKDVKKV
jgi:septal ring factor EnvC (AmiA/AmiB activator)